MSVCVHNHRRYTRFRSVHEIRSHTKHFMRMADPLSGQCTKDCVRRLLVHTCMCMYIYLCVCVCVCACVCVYVCVHTCAHMYTETARKIPGVLSGQVDNICTCVHGDRPENPCTLTGQGVSHVHKIQTPCPVSVPQILGAVSMYMHAHVCRERERERARESERERERARESEREREREREGYREIQRKKKRYMHVHVWDGAQNP